MGIVGASGAVGIEIQKLLSESELCLFDSKSAISFADLDLVFFCVSSERARALIPEARAHGVVCIDASSAYRNDPNVPLVVPEINGPALAKHQGIIASPNCTTTLMLMPLAPLHKQFGIERIGVSTYQAVSGAGRRGMSELEEQTKATLAGEQAPPHCFPTPCAFNVFPHEAAAEEEAKMQTETKRLLEDESIEVTARCIRVPVFRVHSQAVSVTFQKPFTLEEALAVIEHAPGVLLKENTTSLDASGQTAVFCGNVRIDRSMKQTLELWIVGDQLLKGAALNMVQIAQCLQSQKKIESGGFSLR